MTPFGPAASAARTFRPPPARRADAADATSVTSRAEKKRAILEKEAKEEKGKREEGVITVGGGMSAKEKPAPLAQFQRNQTRCK